MMELAHRAELEARSYSGLQASHGRKVAVGWGVVLWAAGLWGCASRLAREDCEPAGQFAAVGREERRVMRVSASTQARGLVAAQSLAFIPPEGEECPNWKPALELARYKAGCDTGALSEGQCRCRRSFPRGCDLCYMLEEGAYPAVYFNRPKPSGTYDKTRRVVLFWDEFCIDSGKVEDFASTMLHEAVHACEGLMGRTTGPTYDEIAYRVENQCFNKAMPRSHDLLAPGGGGKR